MAAGAVQGPPVSTVTRVRVALLGPFRITLDGRAAGPWYRPAARRLCALVMITPSHRLGREVARDLLFPRLAPAASANALSRALSLARQAVAALGPAGVGLLRADRANIWVGDEVLVDIDAEAHEEALRSALKMEPGAERDVALCAALDQDGVLLVDEPYADWAAAARQALELLRQRARLELARDRARGIGQSQPDTVIDAWENCLAYGPSSEEAAFALMRVYSATGQRQLASSAFERCRAALEALGLAVSPALEEARRSLGWAVAPDGELRSARAGAAAAHPGKEERRPVSVLFAQLSGVSAPNDGQDPEETKRAVGSALASAIAEVEGLGGTVTAVSGAGLAAVFGAPEAHEDDPERAVRAGFRMLLAIGAPGDAEKRGGQLLLRIGVETGSAVVGPLWPAAGAGYGATGQVVDAAAALQSAAKPGSVLVGPVTKASTEGIFEWGPAREVAVDRRPKPLEAVYLVRPKARRPGFRGGPGRARSAGLVGRQAEVWALDCALRQATLGAGSVVFVVGEPGLGKTRLVQECRRRFMAWVGAGTGRLPLWLEGRCASYASSMPYGLYRQLLSGWTGVAPEEGDDVVGAALERAVQAVFGRRVDHAAFLGHLMGVRAHGGSAAVARQNPEALQRATFAAVKALVERLTAKGPTVLVLEDLHWADPTSLRLTEELISVAGAGPLLLIATRRPEPDPGVSALESAVELGSSCPFRRLELSPLGDDAERELAVHILGADADRHVIQAVRTNVDGNPLFLEERFLSLVETGALVKEGASWSLSSNPSVDVPQVLERLIRSRVDRVPSPSRQVLIAASVLGPEFSFRALETVSDVGPALSQTVAELCEARLLTEVRRVPEPVLRFRHALIQEAIYRGLLRNERRQLHARAAWGIEAASGRRPEEMAAVIGHHFAMSGESDRAVHHLELAGKYAAARFAVDEAVSLYRKAIAIADEDRGSQGAAQSVVDLRYQLAEVLWRSRRFGEAREALHAALALVSPQRRLQAARLQARLGRVESESNRYDAALSAFEAADKLLGRFAGSEDGDWVDVWLEVQVDGRANLHNWANEPERAGLALAKARPVIESHAPTGRQAGFYAQLAFHQARQKRYQIDEETVAAARAAVRSAETGVGEYDLVNTLGTLGEMSFWHGNTDESQKMFEAALAIAERTYDQECRSWCLCGLCLIGIRRHDVEAVRSVSRQAAEAAINNRASVFGAAANAAMAWVAWKDDRFDDVIVHANEALAAWRSTWHVYFFKGLCLWPLMAVKLASGDIAGAVDAGREMLEPSQVRLPDEVESLIERAKAAWDRDEAAATAVRLTEALQLACKLGFA